MTEHQIPLILSSSTDAGAINKTARGDQFEVQMDRPIRIAKGAKLATVELNQASVWNTIANISINRENNLFKYMEIASSVETSRAAMGYGIAQVSPSSTASVEIYNDPTHGWVLHIRDSDGTIIPLPIGEFHVDDIFKVGSGVLVGNEYTIGEIVTDTATDGIYKISPGGDVLAQSTEIDFSRIDGSNDVYTVVIPDGLYNLDQLSATINRELVNQGVDENVLLFEPDEATQKVVIQFTKAYQQIDMTGNTCRELLGFDERLVPLAPTTGAEFEIGDNPAEFNQIDYYLLYCDIAGMGININGIYKSVIGKMLITSPPGTQSTTQPYNPMRIPIYQRIGQHISQLRCWITDQNGERLDLTDDFSLDLIIRYVL